MQTFLPYSDFMMSSLCLDWKRLGKQRVEAFQIIKINTYKQSKDYKGEIFPWCNHPAVLMWEGFEEALKLYFNCVVLVWIGKGCTNNMNLYNVDLENVTFPFWLGDEVFHRSHKSNLLRKDLAWYERFRWNVPNNLPYFWPVRKGFND